MGQKTIVIIQGHPDPDENHLGYLLADAYARGAKQAGHTVHTIKVADLDFPLLRTADAFENQKPPGVIAQAQDMISQADHLVLLYPLWMGTMPALLKGFLEQLFRPGFAISQETDKMPKKLLKGKSARIIITMGMPAFFYRWYFRAHSLKSLERNILKMCGIGPIKESLFGMVESVSDQKRNGWIAQMESCGAQAN